MLKHYTPQLEYFSFEAEQLFKLNNEFWTTKLKKSDQTMAIDNFHNDINNRNFPAIHFPQCNFPKRGYDSKLPIYKWKTQNQTAYQK